MNTETFINNFAIKETQKNAADSLEKMTQWVYRNPAANKVVEVAGKIWGMVGLVVPPHHEMRNHTFKPASHGAARLYYQGEIPILELDYEDPKKAGIAHGYLLGKYVHRIMKAFDHARTFVHIPNGEELRGKPDLLEGLRRAIPKEYLEEMEGVVEGYNQWALEGKLFKAKTITLEDLLIFHLMPDSLHFSLQRVEKGVADCPLKTAPTPACTAVIDKDPHEGIVFGRNMDWPSFGLFGSHSLVINRKHRNGKLSTVEVGLPGFVGTLTGMNSSGTSLAMNVAIGQTDKVRGMPAAFFNRHCLENCSNIESIQNKVRERPPLGPYHLSTADQTGAKAFHLYQAGDNNHTVREWKQGTPLVTTNCNYSSDTEQSLHMHCSQERDAIINKLYSEAIAQFSTENLERGKLVRGCLALPYVNNKETTHKVVMCPLAKRVQVAFDNTFGGKAPLHELDTTALL